MDSQDKIQIGASSSLIDLKAELLKKQREVKDSKAKGQKGAPKTVTKSQQKWAKNLDAKNKKNSGIDQRNAADLLELEAEKKSCDKAKAVLEAKAKLYERMTREALDHEEMEHPVLANSLVNFQMKAVERYQEERRIAEEGGGEEDFVEFIDTLGRTRRCHKSQLAQAIASDEQLARLEKEEREKRWKAVSGKVGGAEEISARSADDAGVNVTTMASGSYAAVPPPTTLNLTKSVTEDEVKEMIHRKWEKDAEEAAVKEDVHYEDVLFDEVRNHGVSYFGFAKSDEKRQEQIKELKQLSEQTRATRQKVLGERKEKSAQLKERLRKVRARKRARLGLPPKESSSSDDEESRVEANKEKGSDDDDDEADRSESLIPKSNEMRPWDFGKPGVYGPKPVNFDELDAKWLKERRTDRKTDFAPPTTYYTKNQSFDGPSSSRRSGGEQQQHGGIAGAMMGKYGNFVKAATSSSSLSSQPSSTDNVAAAGSSSSAHQYSSPQSAHQHEGRAKVQKAIPIQDELPAPTPDVGRRGGTGAEIPPPATFEYYHGDLSKKKARVSGMTDDAMSDSVSAGLRAIREQVDKEKKQGN